jgi:16S rRNA (cytidine1402-2'-O)-methyltransferase
VPPLGEDKRRKAETTPGTLYLIPTPLSDSPLERVLPDETRRVGASLSTFIVEHAKTARAFLKQLPTVTPIQQLSLLELNEHTRNSELESLLRPLLDGLDVGLLSEAGCPAVADPGAELVRLAHDRGIPVRPLVGPSSILLALMAAGMVGQRFTFHGYLPAKPDERAQALRDLEARAAADNATQIFIETPYRNPAMLAAILAVCRADTRLAVARDLTGPDELILSARIAAWPASPPELRKHPCVFLLWRE